MYGALTAVLLVFAPQQTAGVASCALAPPFAQPVEEVTISVCTPPNPFLRVPSRTTQSPVCAGEARQIPARADSNGVVYRASIALDSNGVAGFTQSLVIRARLNCHTAAPATAGAIGTVRSELSPRLWGLCMSDDPPAIPPSPLLPNGAGTCQGAPPILDDDFSIVLSENVRGGPRGIQMKQDRMTGSFLDLNGHVCVADNFQGGGGAAGPNVFGPAVLTGLYNETLLGGDQHYISFSSDASRNCSTAQVGSPQGRMTTEVQEIGLTVQCNTGDQAKERYLILTGVGTITDDSGSVLTFELVSNATVGTPSFTVPMNLQLSPLVVIELKLICPSSITSPNHPSLVPVFAPVPTVTRGTALCAAFCPLPAFPRSSQIGVEFFPRCCTCTPDADNRLLPNLNDCYDPQPPLASRGREAETLRDVGEKVAEGLTGRGRSAVVAQPFQVDTAVNGALIVDITGCQLQPDILACCNQAYVDIFCSTGAFFTDCVCAGVGSVTCPTPNNHECPASKKALLGLLGLLGIIPALAALIACIALCCLCKAKPVAKGRREPIHAPTATAPPPLIGPASLGTITASQTPVFM